MKIIIAGSRTIFPSYAQIDQAIVDSGFAISEIVSGGAQGADKCGEAFAYRKELPVKLFPADWQTYGKSAGMRRNRQMGDYADGLIAFWDGFSKGTAMMIEYMKGLGKPVYLVVG